MMVSKYAIDGSWIAWFMKKGGRPALAKYERWRTEPHYGAYFITHVYEELWWTT